MSPEQKEEFIKDALYHELCCLLEAATFWRILKDSGIAGCEVSIAMDSAFIHARNLFVFFAPTKEDKKNNNSIKMTDLGPERAYKSRIYSDSKGAVNRHLFHLNKKRLDPINVKGSGHIKEKVEVFSEEILKLWRAFEEEDKLGELKGIARKARLRAEQDTSNTAQSRMALILSNAQAQQTQSSASQPGENLYVS